jgi:hypothetical protein
MSGRDLSGPLRLATVEALKVDAGVAAIVAQRVFDYIPSDRQYPYLRCSAPFTTPWEATGGVSGGITRLQVDAFTKGYDRDETEHLASAITKALDGVELSLTGGYAVYVQWRQSQVLEDEAEQGKFRGIIEFEALAAE